MSTRSALGIAAASLLLLASVGGAQAEDECREARKMCVREAKLVSKECRQDCRSDVQDAMAVAQAICEERQLEPKECRDLVQAAVEGIANECRRECSKAHKKDEKECRKASKECRNAFIDPFDDECVELCREEFGPCHDDHLSCRDECKADRHDAIQLCRDSGLPHDEIQLCIKQARRDGHACELECHEVNTCHGDLHECISECPLEP